MSKNFNSLLLFILIITPMALTHSAQNAVVRAQGAIIYAEKTLKTAIGKIKRGSKVRVGSVARNNGKVLPIIISGRVTWIKVIDLNVNWFEGMENSSNYDGTPRLTEHQVLQTDQFANEEDEDRDKLNENNFLTFKLHRFSYNYIIGENYDTEGDYEAIEGYSGHLHFEHRPPLRLINWGLGLGFYNHSGTDMALTWPTIDGTLYLVPFYSETLAFDLFGAIHFSGKVMAKFRMADDTERESSALSLGFSGGGILRLFPANSFSGHIGFGYQTLLLSDMEKIEYNGEMYEPGLDYISGLTFFLGLSIKL